MATGNFLADYHALSSLLTDEVDGVRFTLGTHAAVSPLFRASVPVALHITDHVGPLSRPRMVLLTLAVGLTSYAAAWGMHASISAGTTRPVPVHGMLCATGRCVKGQGLQAWHDASSNRPQGPAGRQSTCAQRYAGHARGHTGRVHACHVRPLALVGSPAKCTVCGGRNFAGADVLVARMALCRAM